MFGKNVSPGYLAASLAQAAWPFCLGFDGHVMSAVPAPLNERDEKEFSPTGEPFVKVRPKRRELRKRNIIAGR